MSLSKEQKIKEIFYRCANKDTDWSQAADLFVEWTITNNFKTESFREFVNWIDDSEINNLWHFFFGYGDNYELFANDWVEEEERENYLQFCKED